MKKNPVKLLDWAWILMVIGFGIRLWADYGQYRVSFTSAPFYATVIVRAAEFLIPALAMFLAARIISKKK